MGSTNTTIYRLNSGLVLREPSKALCEVVGDKKVVKEVGNKAIKYLGKTPEHMMVISPIQDGIVDDVKVASKILRTFVDKVTSDNPSASISALLNIPCGASVEECRKAILVGCNANITTLNLIPNVIACGGWGRPK